MRSFFAFEKSIPLGNIKIGETREVKIPINALTGVESSDVTFELIAKEANHHNSKPIQHTVNLKAFVIASSINWYLPVASEIIINEDSYIIKACIVSNVPIDNAEIQLNNKPYPIDRGFKLIQSGDCKSYLEKEIKLEKGNNLVQIIAIQKTGKVLSEMRNIIYQEIEKEKRIALIIGNSEYNEAPLRNPVNDANLMSKELKKLEFEVTSIKNGSQNQLKDAISQFGETLAKDKNTVGLFYYAGHGIQIKGKNYLVPVDAKITKEPDVEVYCVDLDGLLANLEYSGNNLNIIILDACRNNPYSRSFRSGAGPGLASVNAPVGTIIAYATAPGSVAADGEGSNGLYTQEFVKILSIPNMKIEDVFKKVRTQVKTISKGTQIPWENSSIEGDFYFVK